MLKNGDTAAGPEFIYQAATSRPFAMTERRGKAGSPEINMLLVNDLTENKSGCNQAGNCEACPFTRLNRTPPERRLDLSRQGQGGCA
jgi:hypothetical protein